MTQQGTVSMHEGRCLIPSDGGHEEGEVTLKSGAELHLDPTDTVKMVELHDECSSSHDAIHHSGWHT